MIKATLWIISKDNKILLCMKKRWFWAWKLNWPWWKVDKCENIENCMIREVKEETTIDVKINDLQIVWYIKFFFLDKPEWDIEVNIFKILKFNWEAIETEEMSPDWYDINNIPYDKMWKDDIYWLPRVLNWEYVEYEFYFKWDEIESYKQIK